MPNPTPESLKNEIVHLHLLGNTNAQIAQDVGTSTGNVSNIINKFKKDVDTGDYQSIRTLAIYCNKNEMTLSGALEGHATNTLLKKNNIDRNSFEKYVQSFAMSKENGIEEQTLLDLSIKLCTVQNQTQMDVEDIPKHYELLLENVRKINSNIKGLQEQEQIQKSKTNEELQKRSITSKILTEFDSAKKILSRNGLDIKDYCDFAKMIDKAKSLEYNIAEIENNLLQEKSHGKQMMELENNIQIQESKKKQNQYILDKQESEISKNTELIKTIDKFASIKISQDHLEHFYVELVYSANKYKISYLEAYDKFYDAIKLYDKQLGLEKHIASLTNKLNSLTDQQSTLETKIKQNTNQIDCLKSEKIKLETYIDTLKSQSIKVLQRYDKKLLDSLKLELDETKQAFSNFRLMLLEALSYYSTKDGKILSSSIDTFVKYMQKIIESNDQLGNLHTIQVINDLLDGKSNDNDIEPLMVLILGKFLEYCKKEHKIFYEKCTKDLLNHMLSAS